MVFSSTFLINCVFGNFRNFWSYLSDWTDVWWSEISYLRWPKFWRSVLSKEMKSGVRSESICISLSFAVCSTFSAMSGRSSSALRGDLLSFAENSSECPRENGVIYTWSVQVLASDFSADTFSSVCERLRWSPVPKWSKVSMIPDDLRLGWDSHSVNGVSVSGLGLDGLTNRLSGW